MWDVPSSEKLDDSVRILVQKPLAKTLLYVMLKMCTFPHKYACREEGFEKCVSDLLRQKVLHRISHGGNPPEFHFRGRLTPDYLPLGKYHQALTELCADAEGMEKIMCE